MDVEFRPQILRGAVRRTDHEGPQRVVLDHEVRLAVELDAALADAEIPRHAQPRGDAEENPGPIRQGQLSPLPRPGGEFAEGRDTSTLRPQQGGGE